MLSVMWTWFSVDLSRFSQICKTISNEILKKDYTYQVTCLMYSSKPGSFSPSNICRTMLDLTTYCQSVKYHSKCKIVWKKSFWVLCNLQCVFKDWDLDVLYNILWNKSFVSCTIVFIDWKGVHNVVTLFWLWMNS